MDCSVNGFFSSFPQLQVFSIHDNDVYGHFNNFDCVSAQYLPDLQEFRLGKNGFSGSLSLSSQLSFGQNLTHFELHKNDFSGTVEWDRFAYLNKLEVIDISDNRLKGRLSMSDNLSLPNGLTYFDIDYNDFDGDIEWNIFQNLYNLTELHLNDNAFTGRIDWDIISDLHNNGKLKNINFQNNDFSGISDNMSTFVFVPLYVIDICIKLNQYK